MEKPQRLVWFPHEQRGYALGRLLDIGASGCQLSPLAAGAPDGAHFEPLEAGREPLHFDYARLFPADALGPVSAAGLPGAGADADDNCALVSLSEPALLENVRLRFQRDKIYTYVAHILLAVNPYRPVAGLHSAEAIARYQGRSLGALPPHVYAIADKAFRDMKASRQSQSIVINGESGAGKTESQKEVLRYLCLSGGQAGSLQSLILAANPLLEAFGNAKTLRNHNSSRFGKFIEVHYSARWAVVGGRVFHYLLEKSRVCQQWAGERNYHIFYQLCACLEEPQRSELGLAPADHFEYLAGGCTRLFSSSPERDARVAPERKSARQLAEGPVLDVLMDEPRCFEDTRRALSTFGLDAAGQARLFRVVAAVLQLGNVRFCEGPGGEQAGCQLEAGGAAQRALELAGRLLGLEAALLREALSARVMCTSRAGHKGTIYMVQLSARQASAARDALAKAVYARLFHHLVAEVLNGAIPAAPAAGHYIGVLDVAGFEFFERNGFEQLLINYCNERLQAFFNQRILREEQAIYAQEGLQLQRVHYSDNGDCLNLFEARPSGLFDLLDDESRLPKPSAAHFTAALHAAQAAHPRLGPPRASRQRHQRQLTDDEGFLVRHYAGPVCYETHLFIDKNNDALHNSLRQLMLESSEPLVRQLFAGPAPAQPGAGPAANKLSFVSVAGTFRAQLSQLLAKLAATGSHFIRCLKPNNRMQPGLFDGAQILAQLHCSGMNSVLELMQAGYPSRVPFADLYATYAPLLPGSLARLDANLFCRALLKALGLRDADFRFGASKLFFRPAKFAEFDAAVRAEPQQLAELVGRVARWLLRARWRKAAYGALSVVKLAHKIRFRRQLLVGLQSEWRRALVRRRLHFRLEAARAARRALASLEELERIWGQQLAGEPLGEPPGEPAAQLRGQLEAFVEEQAAQCRLEAAAAGPAPPAAELHRRRLDTSGRLEELAGRLEALLSWARAKLARQSELAQLQRRLAAELELRERDEAEQRREAEVRQQRQELERRHLSEAGQAAPAAAQAAELAPAARPAPLAAPSDNFAHSRLEQKFDLSRWKYSDLRDTINTSCDLELLEACKREFHRRLKVYHAWRAANARPSAGPGAERAPDSVMRAQPAGQPLQAGQGGQQRYFRIPFVRGQGQPRGWWLAHFDGQWIARQLELHPGRPPILLEAGQHDIEMCELSLHETRLAAKRGAEILPHEFEAEWAKHGGRPWPPGAPLGRQ